MENGKPKVLIVDDEKGLRLGAKRLLEGEGYYVEAAENGTQGIELGTATDFDLALIDVKMPDVDGIEVLRRIKAEHPNTVCLMATGYASYETAVESTKLGAYSYIPKPFTPEELLAHLRKGYERRQLILEADQLRKEREERLLEVAYEKTRLNTIINSIVDGVLVINKKGETALYNPAALRYLNLNDLPLEKYCLDILHPEIVKIIKKYIDSEKYNGNSYSIQLEIKETGLFVEAVCSAVPHPDGTLAGVVIILNNITELKRLDQLKSQFVSMVAHELKTPVAAVLGFIKVILDDSLKITEEQKTDFLMRSYSRLQGLIEMVNDLLDISRIDTKNSQREIKDLNLTEILHFLLEGFEIEIKKRNLKVNVNIAPDLPPLKGDSIQITRMFSNLLSNAIKYNKDSGEVNINMDRENHYIIIKISDTGVGISQENQRKLFNEFFRVKNETTRGISGTGLGLSIVKRIVETYAGKIEVQSEEGKGTIFTISFPVK